MRLAGAVATLILLAPSTAAAQQLHGTVRDSATGRPLPNAVLIFQDSGGKAVGRTVTNEQGAYVFTPAGVVRQMRIMRLGYRPKSLAAWDAARALNIQLATIPPLLDAVRVVRPAKCPRRPDGEPAMALLEQARAGLLATVIAREQNAAMMKRIGFERTMDETSDRVERQEVRLDSVGRQSRSFSAARAGVDFSRDGFSHDERGIRTMFGPDADVLLDDGFAQDYCFRIERPEAARPGQIGLGFFAADRKKGRIDIDGALWIDTIAHVLRDIDFRFVGLDSRISNPPSGGSISFRSLPDGAFLVDRWMIRTVNLHVDSTWVGNRLTAHAWPFVRETGGEVARAQWNDGRQWRGPLGTLHLHIVDSSGHPVTGAIVGLDNTDYLARSDPNGNLVINDLLPGRYSAFFVDTLIAATPVDLQSFYAFTAVRESTVVQTILQPPDERFRRIACESDEKPGRAWSIVHVVRENRIPVPGATWEVGYDLQKPSPRWLARGTADENGVFGFCQTLTKDGPVEIHVRTDRVPARSATRLLRDTLALIWIEFDPQ